MALAINLPGDGGVLRADGVVTTSASGGSSVLSDFLAHFSINNHSSHEIRVIVGFIINLYLERTGREDSQNLIYQMNKKHTDTHKIKLTIVNTCP